MRTETSPGVRLADYAPYPFEVVSARFVFRLSPDETTVMSRLSMKRTGPKDAPLRLDGEKLTLRRLLLNGEEVPDQKILVDADGITLADPGDAFEIEIETELCPANNSELSGLYLSGGRFCTQCEAEGFRRITYYPDRPDVLAPFHVRIEANGVENPFLLSNGNPGASGPLAKGWRFAEWTDPHPKPSYLFALVAGDLDTLEDSFTTRSGRMVRLVIYVDKGDAPRAAFAMASLKRAMAWDEDTFGREYDLDIFQIVAIRDFNFGAMENKGLNIFNSAYVLADISSATDADFEAIESVVAHEYLHNWTGNRITCRDWFQLCLKEGLTVYRDQEFTKAVRSPAVARIKEVIRLRTRQFPEDAGPLAHPVRPDAYSRIDNLYTSTVYEKGAEIIRMLRLLIGEEAFFAGMNRYFDTKDGKAATVEDFLDAFQASTSLDLTRFALWYAQSGTPEVSASGRHDAARKAFVLTLRQDTPPTPGQTTKHPLVIPLRTALFDPETGAIRSAPVPAGAEGATENERVLVLDAKEQTFTFPNIARPPVVSLNRGFSAPIRLVPTERAGPLADAVSLEDDPFGKWDRLQDAARRLLLSAQNDEAIEAERQDYVAAVSGAVEAASEKDPAFAALLLQVPPVIELVVGAENADPDRLHSSRQSLRQAVASRLEARLAHWARALEQDPPQVDAMAIGRRALQAQALSLLATFGDRHVELIRRAFDSSITMTVRLAALAALSGIETQDFDAALANFERDWGRDALVMDKWFSVQGASVRADLRERLKRLAVHPQFDPRNPNRVRALAAAFGSNNPVGFHAADGWGYRFLGDIVLRIDPLNPALSARLATAFESWRSFDLARREQARVVLEGLLSAGLSRNARDIVERALSEAAA